jgi:antitoxin component of MazEF toxin-antitoxin module
MPGNVGNRDGMNVPMRLLTEIFLVGDLGIIIPIRGKHAFATCALKRDAETTDAAKQVNESESF